MTYGMTLGKAWSDLLARAEKAEKERDALACDHEPCDHEEQVERLEARIADLLEQHCGHCGKPWVVKVREGGAR